MDLTTVFLLAYLGGKMIYEGTTMPADKKESDIYSFRHIMTLSLATSIDALVVGFSYALAETEKIFGGAAIIGAVTFIFSMLGIRTENKYAACVEGLDGFVCTIDTFEELKKEVLDGIIFHFEGLHKDGDPVP